MCGPFLVFPLLLLLIDFMTRGLRLSALAIMIFLIGGLFLSFSRGAWVHFAISAAVTVVLLLAAATEPRMRILFVSIAAVIGLVLFVVVLISIPAVHDMFLERAKVIQPYDIGPGGRFWEQRLALGVILESPNGLGPFVTTNPTSGAVGKAVTILGSDLTGATSVTFNGVSASLKVVSKTKVTTTAPTGATTGTVEVVTPSGTLKSNVDFRVKG